MRISGCSSDVCSSDLFDGCSPLAVILCERCGEIGLVRRDESFQELNRRTVLHTGVNEVETDENEKNRHVRHEFAFQPRSEEHTSELQSLMRISYAVFCLKKKKKKTHK